MAEITTIPPPPTGKIVNERVLQVLSTGFGSLNLARGFGGTSDPTQIWTAMLGNAPEAFNYYFDIEEKDDDVGGLLDTLKASVLGRKRTVLPANDSVEAQRVAAFIEAQIKAIPAFHQVLHALLDGPGYGLSVAEIEFDVTAGQVGVLSIEDCLQECFAFAEQRWLPQIGPLRFLSNPYAATGELVPECKFLLFSYNPRKGNRFGRPLLRRAFFPSWFKRNAIRFWLRFAEKAPGTAAVKYPSGASEDEQKKALAAAEALIEKVAIAVPSNFELVEELLTSARSQNPAVYERLVQRNELAIARAILGETLTSHGSEGGAGSYSLGQVHQEIFRQRTIELSKALEAVINDQLVRRLVLWNFGPDAPMPRWKINTKDPDELSVRIKLDQILQSMGLQITENYARSMYGIPKPAEADQVLQPRPLQVPQTGGGIDVASPGDVPPRSNRQFADARGKDRARIDKDQGDLQRFMGQIRREAIEVYRTRVRQLADAEAGGAR